MLQVADPRVAQGVADHSDFRKRPLARLIGTLDFLIIVTFGTEQEAERVGHAVRRVHDRVTGPGYSGNDPELQVWVNATLIDAALYVYTEVLGSPSGDLADEYVRQAALVAEVLGCPPDQQPADLASFRRYMDEKIAALEVSDTGREVARAVLWPQRPRWLRPAGGLNRFLTIGLLPPRLREQFDLPWSARDERLLRLLLRTGATGYRLVPGPVRRSPRHLALHGARRRIARRARAHAPA
ncbi:DUF2236 domain-containing protein [Actinomadura craniellae]|uniref:DUF2236 domain-containing protein n=2 Tax=Actinomadura craniellae TaxID=2231787 RepID=A0A365H4Y4_9ACTN|nr:DUF2236 domain-containing protein [Actinomadura craniellae]